MDLLVFFALNTGQVVSKEEILNEVWSAEVVSEGTLTHVVAILRQVLDDDARNPQFIETIPTRGYRLIAPVKTVEHRAPAAADRAAPRGALSRRWRVLVVLAVVSLVAGGTAISRLKGTPGFEQASESQVRILVLPFDNLGPPEDEFLSAGLADEITARITVESELCVISRDGAGRCGGPERSIREVGELLGVDYVVTGTIHWDRGREDGRVRIMPRLVRVADDSQQWAEVFDYSIGDAFAVQENVAAEVTCQLAVILAR